MLTDSVNGKKNDGTAKESIQVLDVAQLLLDSVKTPAGPGMTGMAGPGGPGGPDVPEGAVEPESAV
jgi:hypothetical protein